MEQDNLPIINETINKTLFTARLIDGFWDRWIVHGVQKEDLAKIRPTFTSKKQWMTGWTEMANNKMDDAKLLEQNGSYLEAEVVYRTAGLYLQLAQWILPVKTEEKLQWLDKSLKVFRKADMLSIIETMYETIDLNGTKCYGRVRIPAHPQGVVVIINPFDSTKEELFTYEMDYTAKGYITVSFDGPGQGQTYICQGFKATKTRWMQFVDGLIEYAHAKFSQYPMYLFGSSSGAAWAIYGSCSPLVTKAVAISPAFSNDTIALPDYFVERMGGLIESNANIIPDYDSLTFQNPVLLAHGKKDVMVSDDKIYDLYEQLPKGKKLLEYENEGHCCNYKLPEIRRISIDWFKTRMG